MKHISILIPRGAAAFGCIEGAYALFNKTNEFLENRRKPALFNTQLVGLTKETQKYDRSFTVCPNVIAGEIHKTDLIIIPAVNGDMKKSSP